MKATARLRGETPGEYRAFLLDQIKASRAMIRQAEFYLKHTDVPDFWYGVMETEQANIKEYLTELGDHAAQER